MATGYVLYNPQAGRGNSAEEIRVLDILYTEPLKYIDVRDVKDYGVFLRGLEPEDIIVLAGGDGTLNRFANAIADLEVTNEVRYYPSGTGNDFAHDLGYARDCTPFPVNRYLTGLPTVQVKGETHRFLNGVGYGIDGYCCQEGDRLRREGKRVNYTTIAVLGLLFHYKPTAATVTVDGVPHHYKRVWLAPTMNGRCYGGGMIPTPGQDRLGEPPGLSTLVFHGCGRLRTLMMFPSIFKGEHLKYRRHAEVLTGQEITVTYDRPVPLQFDGETVTEVNGYTACVAKAAVKST